MNSKRPVSTLLNRPGTFGRPRSSNSTLPFKGLTLMLILFCIAFLGCGRHPKATSRDSLDFIKQVYTACNTKNTKRLATCKERLAELESMQKISIEEVRSFERMLEIATKGDWEAAQSMALKSAQDQIR